MVYRIENDDGKFSRVVHADRLKKHFQRRAADIANPNEMPSEEESDLEVYIECSLLFLLAAPNVMFSFGTQCSLLKREFMAISTTPKLIP